MPDLLTECREAAPEWMAREGWFREDARHATWHDGPAALWVAAAGESVRLTGRVDGIDYAEVATYRERLAPALAYVAGEVRAEMVARGLAEGLPPEPREPYPGAEYKVAP